MPVTFAGIWPALVTPMRADESIAFDVLERLTDLFATQRLGGLYVTGSTGQWPLLTAAERQEVAAVVVRAAAGRIPVMVHVGTPSTAEAIALARHAERIGADAVSAIAPTYFPHSADVVFEHYRRIGSACSRPLFIYHMEMVHRLNLPPREYAERILSLPNIAGMKITSLDLYLFGLLSAFGGDRLQLFSGADEVVCQAWLSGAAGAIGTFYNLWGPAVQRGVAAQARGDVAAARDFVRRFQTALSEVLGSGAVWSFLRAAMQRKYGLDIGRPRAPLGSLDRDWLPQDVDRVLALVDG